MDNHLKQVTSKEQDSIFQPIVEAISRTMNLPVSVWVLDEQSQTLSIKAAVGLPARYVRKAFLSLSEPSVTGECFKSGEVVIVHNVLSDSRWKYRKEAKEAAWKSVLCVPIQAHSVIIGVLNIYTFVERDFSDLEKQLLTDYATQIGARLDADRRLKTIRRLLDIGDEFERLVTGQPKVVLKEIVKGACEVTGADCAVIYPYDPTREEFYDKESVAAHGLNTPLRLTEKPRTDKGMAAYVKRVGEVVISDIEKEDPAMLTSSPFIAREGINAFMGITLEIAGQVLGILYVDFRTPHQFSEEEKDTIRLFAHQAAIAIDNSRLYQQAGTRAEALKKLHELGPTLVSVSGAPGSLKNILKQIVQNARGVLGADLVDLYQYIQSRDEYVLPPIQVGKRYDLSVRKDRIYEDDVVCTIVKSRQPRYVAETQQEPTLTQPYTVVRPDAPPKRFVIREGIKSTAIVPLILGAEVVGVLFANYRSLQSFPQQQQELIELFASQAAIAIRNARLFEQRRALQGIARDITRIINKDKLLQNILDRSLKLLGCEIGSISLLNKATNQLEFQYAIGKERFLSVPFGEGLIGTAAATRKPVRVGDVTHDTRYIKHVEATRSELDVPMLVGKELVGVLNAESTRYNAFDGDSEELAVTLAGQAAVALYNATLFEQRTALVNIARDVVSELDRDTLIQKIIERSVELIGCETGAVGLIDPTTNAVIYKYGFGLAAETLQPIPHGKGLTGKAIATGKPVRAGNVHQETEYIEHLPSTNSELIVPLKVGQAVLGVLDFQSPLLDAFTKHDEELALGLAGHAAVALYNAELFQRTQERLEQRLNDLKALQDVYEAVGQAPLAEVLRLITERAVSLTSAQYGNLWLLERGRDELRFGVEVSLLYSLPRRGDRIPVDEHSINGWVALTGKPYLCGDVACDKHYQKILDDIRAELAVPLRRGNRIIGTLNVENTKPAAFTEDHRRLLEALASQATIAIDDACLYDRLNTLITVGQALTSGIRLREDEVLDLIRTQASKLMDTDNMYIALYDEATDTVRFGLAFVDGRRIDVTTEEGWQPRKAGKGRTEEIIRTKKPMFHATKSEAEAWYARPEHKEYLGTPFASRHGVPPTFASWFGVPMMAGKKVLGVIATYHPTLDYVYSSDDLEILQAMANQAAIALDNSHMFYNVNQRLEALVGFGRAVTSGIRLREDEVLELIYTQASKLMDTDNMYIALYDETIDTVRFGLGMIDGKRVNIEAEKGWEPRRAGKGRTEEIIRTKKPMLTTTKAEAEVWYAKSEHKEYWGRTFASWLGVPMMAGEKVLGVIATYHSMRDYVYSGDDLAILRGMANQAAVAIDNARLTYGLEQAVEERTRQLREEQEKNIAIGRLAAVNTVVAEFVHRMNNIAGTIPVRVELIRELLDTSDPRYPKLAKFLDAISEDVDGILRAAEDIRLSTVTTEPLELVNVGTLVSTAIKRIAVPSSISVYSNCAQDLPPVLVFSGPLVNALENIVRNSIEAIEGSGSVTIVCRTLVAENQEWIAIDVEDTGRGIPPGDLPKIFDLFFSTKPGGMGFALWRAKTLVESLGGKITVSSEVGKGTVFTIFLPVAKEVKK